jgi:hypothetical protein
MGAILGTESTIFAGQKRIIDSVSPKASFAVVFEDDTETGYFYGLDTARATNTVLDAMPIYNVQKITDRHVPSKLTIVWSADGLKAALLINDYPHAVFDFEARRGYCRMNSPPPNEDWTTHSHEWDDSAIDLFL